MEIREYREGDFEQIWPIFHEIVSAGETYPYPRDITKSEAFRQWIELPRATYVAEEDNKILGTYYIKSNQPGLGSHVCNCGYMVHSEARGRGIATCMCEHSQQASKALGYLAMQFNLVVSTNTNAIRLWNKLGLKTIGKLPGAFHHPTHGFVDALIMYKWLGPSLDPQEALPSIASE